MRNLARITNYANRIESLKDWQSVVTLAIDLQQYAALSAIRVNLQDSGWRKIDRKSNELLTRIADNLGFDLSGHDTIKDKVQAIREFLTREPLPY